MEGEPGAGREALKHMRDLPPQHTHTHARTHTHGHGIVRGLFIEADGRVAAGQLGSVPSRTRVGLAFPVLARGPRSKRAGSRCPLRPATTPHRVARKHVQSAQFPDAHREHCQEGRIHKHKQQHRRFEVYGLSDTTESRDPETARGDEFLLRRKSPSARAVR